MIWSSRSALPSQKDVAHLFHVQKNTDFHDFNNFNNLDIFFGFGSKAPGAHGTLHFLRFFENLFYGLGPI